MALLKAVRFTFVLLAIYCSLEHQRYKETSRVDAQLLQQKGFNGINPFEILSIAESMAALNSSEFLFQVVINWSDVELLSIFLTREYPVTLLNGTVFVSNIKVTTVCRPNLMGYQCTCAAGLAWSYNNCITHEACDDINGNTCGCINALPADGQYCQPNTTLPETVNINLLLEVLIPAASLPPNGIDDVRAALRMFSFPYIINQHVKVVDVNVTTVCNPKSTGGMQCQCEEQFAWSCDKCDIYGPCSNATSHTCECINGLPSEGEMCKPSASVVPCPTLTPEISTPMTTTTPLPTSTTKTLTTTPTTTPPPPTKTMATTTPLPTSTTKTLTTTPTTTPPPTTKTRTTTPLPTSTTKTLTTTPTTTPPPTTKTRTTTPLPTSTTKTLTTTPTTIQTTTSKTEPTATTTMPTTRKTINANLSFAMNIVYEDEFNNPNNNVYKDVDKAIQTQSKEYISTLQSAKISTFRSGSTIVNYTITATTFGEGEVEAVKVGILTNLAENYSMIFDSPSSIPIDPPFFGKSLKLTCGPITEILEFNGKWTAEWRRNGAKIITDSLHSVKNEGRFSILTIKRFFPIDAGLYECRLKDRHVFTQKSNVKVSFKELPIIRVEPLRKKIKCEIGESVLLQCSVNGPYKVEFKEKPAAGKDFKISFVYTIDECSISEVKFTCQAVNTSYTKEVTLELSTEDFLCVSDTVFGMGVLGDRALGPCDPDMVGEKIAECQETGTWKVIEENCVLKPINKLLEQSEFINNNSLAAFLVELSNVTLQLDDEVVESPANINALVDILNNVAGRKSTLNIIITQIYMKDILLTAGVLTTDAAKQSWDFLNTKSTRNRSVTSPTERNSPKAESASSELLLSLETITSNLDSSSFEIVTPSILLNKTTFKDSFNGDFSSSVEIDIPQADEGIKSITVLTFSSMDNVLPARDEDDSTLNVINGRVVLVKSSGTINNISFAFDVINNTLRNPLCVFWNFSLFDGLGGWDGEGCQLIRNVNQTVTCTCIHLTSFSILMSSYVPDSPVLDYITYIGVGISMVSLVICLIIECIIWRKIRKNNTSYLRHVAIVNIAVSLLIANIWFIIGAAISDEDVKNPPACNAATFFIHFFYLSLFFWMLASALLLLYRTISVFGGDLSKNAMLAIGFSLGYGAPLIIAVITIAVTAPSGAYIRETGVCWLNWEASMALLAFVIPALTIVVINLGILLVVLYKMLRRRSVVDTSQAAEKNALAVIARALAFLTPFFGLTWGLGVGTMTARKGEGLGIHIAFAFFNSLQGFFILLFGTLLDKKIWTEIKSLSQTSRSGTRSTSEGTSSSGWAIFRNWRRGRDGYNVSSNGDGSYYTNS